MATGCPPCEREVSPERRFGPVDQIGWQAPERKRGQIGFAKIGVWWSREVAILRSATEILMIAPPMFGETPVYPAGNLVDLKILVRWNPCKTRKNTGPAL